MLGDEELLAELVASLAASFPVMAELPRSLDGVLAAGRLTAPVEPSASAQRGRKARLRQCSDISNRLHSIFADSSAAASLASADASATVTAATAPPSAKLSPGELDKLLRLVAELSLSLVSAEKVCVLYTDLVTMMLKRELDQVRQDFACRVCMVFWFLFFFCFLHIQTRIRCVHNTVPRGGRAPRRQLRRPRLQ